MTMFGLFKRISIDDIIYYNDSLFKNKSFWDDKYSNIDEWTGTINNKSLEKLVGIEYSYLFPNDPKLYAFMTEQTKRVKPIPALTYFGFNHIFHFTSDDNTRKIFNLYQPDVFHLCCGDFNKNSVYVKQIIKEVRSFNKKIKIIVCTYKRDQTLADELYRLGADVVYKECALSLNCPYTEQVLVLNRISDGNFTKQESHTNAHDGKNVQSIYLHDYEREFCNESKAVKAGFLHDLKRHIIDGYGFFNFEDVARHAFGKNNVYGTFYNKIENIYYKYGSNEALKILVEATNYAKKQGDLLQYWGFMAFFSMLQGNYRMIFKTALDTYIYCEKQKKLLYQIGSSHMQMKLGGPVIKCTK